MTTPPPLNHQALTGSTRKRAIPIPVPMRIVADLARFHIRSPRDIAVPELNGGVIRAELVPWSRQDDRQWRGEAADDVDGLRGVDFVLVANLVAQSIEDGRLERVRGAVLGDLVVREVHSAFSRRVRGLVGGPGPDRLGAGDRVVRRGLKGQAEDLVHLRGVLHGGEFHGGPNAVGPGFAAVGKHQVGSSWWFFRKDLHEILLELCQRFRGVLVGLEVGEALGIGPADVCQAVVFRVPFRDVDIRVGSQPREKQRRVSRRRDDRASAVVDTRNISVVVLGPFGVVFREWLSILGQGEANGGEEAVQ